jgi:hypothetical protein
VLIRSPDRAHTPILEEILVKCVGYFFGVTMEDARIAPYATDLIAYIGHLKDLGLHISADTYSRNSEVKALHYIPRVGIQRFHNYFYDLSQIDGDFRSRHVGIDDVFSLYKFDRKLRLHVLDLTDQIF